MNLIDKITSSQIRTDIPEFRVGDTIRVGVKITEKDSKGNEKVTVIYESDLNEDNFENLLTKNLEKDRQLTYTSKGIHKDDLRFEMNGNLIKKFGSQGQQKSFLIALKLAQIKRIKEITNKNPILLLDDIFDKLDDNRVSQLIELVNQQNFGQISTAFIRIINEDDNEEILRYDLAEDFSIETAIIIAELYKSSGEWKFRAVGSGFRDGLNALCRNFGVNV